MIFIAFGDEIVREIRPRVIIDAINTDETDG